MRMTAKRTEVLRRRELVASYAAQRLSVRKIAEVLSTDMRRSDGKAWTYGVVFRDLKALCAQWRERIEKDIGGLQAESLNTYTEILASSTEIEDKPKALEIAMKAQAHIDKLLGLSAPDKRELSGGLAIKVDETALRDKVSRMLYAREESLGVRATAAGITAGSGAVVRSNGNGNGSNGHGANGGNNGNGSGEKGEMA